MVETGQRLGTVEALWRYPVKSMQGEALDASEVDENGLLGDRALALYDVDTGRVASAKSPRLWPNLLEFRASFIGTPRSGEALPPVLIELPDGRSARTDDGDVDELLSEATGRNVRLVSSNPEGATYEQYLPAVEDADPEGTDLYRDVANDVFGRGSLHDASPMHLVTTATLTHLGRLRPGSSFDVRRFRPNVVVALDDPTPRFAENDWVKRQLRLGGVSVRVTMPTLRCVMTTRPQPGLAHDLDVLRTVTAHNRIPVLRIGSYPCVGVNGLITEPGIIGRGDTVLSP